MAARRQVQQGAAAFQQQGMNQLAALRADEMERARSAWGQQVGQMRGQDYQGAGIANQFAQTEAQKVQAEGAFEMQQRELNQRGQLAYEGLAWDTNNAALNADLGRSQMEQNAYQFGRQMDQMEADRTQRYVAAGVGAGGSLAGSLLDYAGQQQSKRPPDYSDMRAKVPLLLDVGKKAKAATPNFLSQYMDAQNVRRDNEHAREEHEERMDDIVQPHQDISRDDPYAGPTPGGIQREDPYGSGEVFYSDENAKREAFQAGVLYSDKVHAGVQEPVPEYMRPKPAGAEQIMKRGSAAGVEGAARGGTSGGTLERVGKSASAAGVEGAGRGGTSGGALERISKSATQGATRGAAEGAVRGPRDGAVRVEPLDRDGPKYAPRIDPNARGEKVKPEPLPPPTAEIGARPVERGRPSFVPAPQPKEGHGPLAALQQDANRRMAGFPYAYKEGFRPPEQAPGELNYGPSAQELERNPLTATAVKPDPNGMRAIDVNKLVKTQSAGIASLQQQIDELRSRRHG